MTIEKHDLLHDFPEYREKIHKLNSNNEHFAHLFKSYHEVDYTVHRIEDGFENTSDDYLESRKLERLRLKDQLYKMLQDA